RGQHGQDLGLRIVFALRVGQLIRLRTIEECRSVDAGVGRLPKLVGRLRVEADGRRRARFQRAKDLKVVAHDQDGVREGQVRVVLDRAGELPVYELEVRAQLWRRAHRLGREATQHEGGHPWQHDSVVVDVDADAARARPRSERSRAETAV